MTDAIPPDRNSAQPFRRAVAGMLADVFPGSSPQTRTALTASSTPVAAQQGMPIFRQGEAPRLSIVVSGHVALLRRTPEGREFLPVVLSRGDLAGLLALAALPAAFDLVALTDAELGVWQVEDVRGLLRDCGLVADCCAHALELVARLADRFDMLLPQGSRARVARVLWLHRDLLFGAAPVLSRALLPQLIGTSPEMTRRVLRELEREQLLRRSGRRGLELLSPEGLEIAARPDGQPTPGSRDHSSRDDGAGARS